MVACLKHQIPLLLGTLGRYCCKWIILAVFAAAPKVVGQGEPVHDYVDRYFYLGNNFNAPVI